MFKKTLGRLLFIIVCGLLLNSCKVDHMAEVVMYTPFYLGYNMNPDSSKVDTFIERETYDLSTELEGDLARNNSSKNQITSAKLIELRIQVGEWAYLAPEKYSNFSDISAIEVDVKKKGLGQEMIAGKLIPDVYTRGFTLDLRDIELKDYLKQDTLNLVIRYKKRRAMKNEMPFYIEGRFKIMAKPL